MPDDTRTDLRAVMARSAGTFLQDTAGVISLVILLVAGLNLPAVL